MDMGGADNLKKIGHVVSEILLANPRELFVSVDEVNHQVLADGVMSEDAYGVCLQPRLSGSMPESNQPKVKAPIPVFAGGLTKIRLTSQLSTDLIAELEADQGIEVRYHSAGYPAKTLIVPVTFRKLG